MEMDHLSSVGPRSAAGTDRQLLAALPALRAMGEGGKMSRGRMDSCLLLTVIIFSLVLGGILLRGRPDLTAAERERARIKNAALEKKLALDVEQKESLMPWIVAAKVASGILAFAAVAGAVVVALLSGVRRALTVAPNRQGIYPLLVGRISATDGAGKKASAWAVYDPNRSPGAVTLLGDGKPAVAYPLPDGVDQARITAQAQAVQALAAVASGEGGGDKAGELVAGVMGQAGQITRPLPGVKRSPWEPGHVERLLIKSGALEADYE